MGVARGAAGGGHVETLVGPASAPGRPELADVATGAVRAVHREDTSVKLRPGDGPEPTPDRAGPDEQAPGSDQPAFAVESVPVAAMPTARPQGSGLETPDRPATRDPDDLHFYSKRPASLEAQDDALEIDRVGHGPLRWDHSLKGPEAVWLGHRARRCRSRQQHQGRRAAGGQRPTRSPGERDCTLRGDQ